MSEKTFKCIGKAVYLDRNLGLCRCMHLSDLSTVHLEFVYPLYLSFTPQKNRY